MNLLACLTEKLPKIKIDNILTLCNVNLTMFLPRDTVRSFSPSGKKCSVEAFWPLRALLYCSEAQNTSRNCGALGSIDSTCSCIKLTLMAHCITPWVKLHCHGPEEHPTARCGLWTFSSGPPRIFLTAHGVEAQWNQDLWCFLSLCFIFPASVPRRCMTQDTILVKNLNKTQTCFHHVVC